MIKLTETSENDLSWCIPDENGEPRMRRLFYATPLSSINIAVVIARDQRAL